MTLRFLKVVYAIVVVVILLAGLAFLIVGLGTGTSTSILGAIIFAPLITLIYLIFARITFEVIAMFFRIGDNTFLAVTVVARRQPRRPVESGNTAQFWAAAAVRHPGVPDCSASLRAEWE